MELIVLWVVAVVEFILLVFAASIIYIISEANKEYAQRFEQMIAEDVAIETKARTALADLAGGSDRG